MTAPWSSSGAHSATYAGGVAAQRAVCHFRPEPPRVAPSRPEPGDDRQQCASVRARRVIMFPQCVHIRILAGTWIGGHENGVNWVTGARSSRPASPWSPCLTATTAKSSQVSVGSASLFSIAQHIGIPGCKLITGGNVPATGAASGFPDRAVIVLRQACQVTRVSLFAFISELCPNRQVTSRSDRSSGQ